MHVTGGMFDEIAIVIAANGQEPKRHEDVGGFPRFERPGQAVSEIDDVGGRDPLRRDIRKHRLEGGCIAMNVGDRCKPHQLPR